MLALTRRGTCLLACAITIPLGLFWRLAPLHLPPFAFKYGGSALWAIAVYWAVAAGLVSVKPGLLAVIAAAIAAGVEFLKKLYWPPLDHFRQTLWGKLLLGRFFSVGAIVAYWLAIALVAACDRWLLPRARAMPGQGPRGA